MLHILVGIQPKNIGLIALKNEITKLKRQLQNVLDLKNNYEAKLNKLGIFSPQIAKVPVWSKDFMTKLSDQPYMSQQWLKDQIKSGSEKIFKVQKLKFLKKPLL